MLKTMLFMTFILSTYTLSANAAAPDFEAELRALETHQLQTEELQMRNADAVTDVISDEVGTGQAATVRSTTTVNELNDIEPVASEKKIDSSKVRRIRSR